MLKKSETLDNYKQYKAWAKVQQNIPAIKTFGSDHGGEFKSKEFTDHLEQQGTVRHLTVHDSPQSKRQTALTSKLHEPC